MDTSRTQPTLDATRMDVDVSGANKRKLLDSPPTNPSQPPDSGEAAPLTNPTKKPYNDVPERLLSLTRNRYPSEYSGSFEVHFEKYMETGTNEHASICELFFGRAAARVFPAEWELSNGLSTLGRQKFATHFPDAATANAIVSHFFAKRADILPHSRWVAYIPNYKLHKQVVTRDIANFVTPEEIMDELAPPPRWSGPWPRVLAARCIRRRVPDGAGAGSATFVNTNLYVLTFDRLQVPATASLWGKVIHFTPFYQSVRRCSNCQRFGHVESGCRGGSTAQVCEHCASKEHRGTACREGVKRCVNCIRHKLSSVSHSASSTNCPVFVQARKIKIIMAKHDCSPREAQLFYDAYDNRLDPGWYDVAVSDSMGSVDGGPSFVDACKNSFYPQSLLPGPVASSTPRSHRSPSTSWDSNFPALGAGRGNGSSSSGSNQSRKSVRFDLPVASDAPKPSAPPPRGILHASPARGKSLTLSNVSVRNLYPDPIQSVSAPLPSSLPSSPPKSFSHPSSTPTLTPNSDTIHSVILNLLGNIIGSPLLGSCFDASTRSRLTDLCVQLSELLLQASPPRSSSFPHE